MFLDNGNKFFVFIVIINMIRSLMSTFGYGMWDVFVAYKIVYEIMDICFNFLTK